MELQELISNIEQWADDTNLIEGSTPQKQMLKLMEEFGELCGGIAKNKIDVIKDSIGDCFVVLVILNKQVGNDSNNLNVFSFGDWVDDFSDVASNLLEYINDGCTAPLGVVGDLQNYAHKFNLDFNDCVLHAYNEIKDRKGKMIDGVFVKEEDL